MVVESLPNELNVLIWEQINKGAKWRILKQDSNYKISSFGLIIRGNHTIVDKLGKRIPLKAMALSSYICRQGYPAVDIKDNHFYIHRLLAQHFIPNPFNKPYVNHINGVKTDFTLSNLEWCTPSENSKHAYDIGLRHYVPQKKKAA
jgi:hypothetical protein